MKQKNSISNSCVLHEVRIKNNLNKTFHIPGCVVIIRISLTSQNPPQPDCQAVMCLSLSERQASLHSWRLNRSSGGHSYADPSAVAQLEQCKFIKENKRRNSGPAKILRGFQHAPRVMSWKWSVAYALDGLQFNIHMSPLSVWQSGNITIPTL